MAPSAHLLPIQWLLRLRWLTALGQTCAILAAKRLLPDEIGAPPMLAVVAFSLLSNLWLTHRHRRQGVVAPRVIGSVLALDVGILTLLLYFSGGAANPFTSIYLVHITMAAVVMQGPWAWGLGALSLAGYGTLFLWNVHVHSLSHMDHDGGVSLHLVGMWMAFATTAALIAGFVGWITRLLHHREEELAGLKDLAARQSRLAALTTLAAGAAHELGTPLGSIAIAAQELERAVVGLPGGGLELAQDAALIRSEVARCRRILDQMAEPGGATLGETFVTFTWEDLEGELRQGFPMEAWKRVHCQWPQAFGGPMPLRNLARVARALISNALEASQGGEVQVSISQREQTWCLRVADPGVGMPPEVLAHAGEPFFTTKAPGLGMGLGLFISRTFAEQLGGSLQINSTPERGTEVLLVWPDMRHA